jgi:hypothetical protein
VTTIAELIAATKGDRSYNDLERDSGNLVSGKRWQQIGAGQPGVKTYPDPESIPGMAKALRVSQEAIVDAYSKALGIEIGTPSQLIMMMPPGTEDLTTDSVRILREIIARFIDADRAAAPATDTGPSVGSVSRIKSRRG